MIQAPQMQYIPAQQPMQTGYQPQQTYSPVQYNQTPGVFYNYPTTSCYTQPYCTDKSQYNGVNIEIINPQGQGVVPQQGCQMPAQFVPVQQPVMVPQYTMPAPVSQAINQAPQPMAPQLVPQAAPQVAPQVVTPQIPAPQVVTPQQIPVQQAPAQPVDPNAAQPQVAPQTVPVVEQPATPDTSVSPEAFAGRLKSSDVEAQKAAIEEVAEMVKDNKTAGPVLLDTQIFDALVDIIDKDTSSLEGPSPEVLELRQKPQDQLSEADKTKASTPTPLENAEINKLYSLYTISYMQERLNKELEERNGKALELKDLPCIEKVIDTAKTNPNPMLRIGAIASLSHIARPEYKADLSTIFELAKNDEDARVKEAATKAADALNK
ncbi:hypothetical protein IJ182_09065 [bacterium]|nr:hypothetical protein [bacterium]